ncbi:hypothetical protein [Azotobacter chroococcum]|uniref:hypothetical protein n=1 Tax=Azotobacter chroococcum TaxID=353 RepID=UPI0012FE1F6C|nr:hypothetical protein [Azotobacter chroococcum]
MAVFPACHLLCRQLRRYSQKQEMSTNVACELLEPAARLLMGTSHQHDCKQWSTNAAGMPIRQRLANDSVLFNFVKPVTFIGFAATPFNFRC